MIYNTETDQPDHRGYRKSTGGARMMTALELCSFLTFFGFLLIVIGGIADNYVVVWAGVWGWILGIGAGVLYYIIDSHLCSKELERQELVAVRESVSRKILEQEHSLLTYNPYDIVRIAERKAEEAFLAHDSHVFDSDYFVSRLNHQLDEGATYETEPHITDTSDWYSSD